MDIKRSQNFIGGEKVFSDEADRSDECLLSFRHANCKFNGCAIGADVAPGNVGASAEIPARAIVFCNGPEIGQQDRFGEGQTRFRRKPSHNFPGTQGMIVEETERTDAWRRGEADNNQAEIQGKNKACAAQKWHGKSITNLPKKFNPVREPESLQSRGRCHTSQIGEMSR